MSMFETGAVWLMGLMALSGYGLMLLAHRRQRAHLDRLEKKLELFVETSINVARCVDRLSVGDTGAPPGRVASRRWLLEEARMRMASGARARDLAVPLGLSRDEVRLLDTRAH